jgi:rubrerythrin
MGEMARRRIHEAFVAEAKAHFRLKAFARRADEEGYPVIARLFRAVAEAEGIHAANHFALLDRVGDTEENLKLSFEKETFVNEVAYPQFLKDAWAEQDKAAIWLLTQARNAEERHAALYRSALSRMVAEILPDYFVCGRCGWVEEGHPPPSCPNCQAPPEAFRRVD